jgi:hypothetical protein
MILSPRRACVPEEEREERMESLLIPQGWVNNLYATYYRISLREFLTEYFFVINLHKILSRVALLICRKLRTSLLSRVLDYQLRSV